MVNLGSAIKALYPQARFMLDYSISFVNGEFVYDFWDTEKLGPKPSMEEVEAAYAQWHYDMTERKFSNSVQFFMDNKAKEMGYDNVFTAVSYVGDPDPVFNAEGRAFLRWRSAVWRFSADYLLEVKQGLKPLPTVEEYLEMLPKFTLEE